MPSASHDLPPITDLGNPMADPMKTAIARAIATPYVTPGRVGHTYAVDVGAGMDAELLMKRPVEGNYDNGYIPDEVRLNVGVGKGKSRTIEAKVEMEQESSSPDDIYALSVRVGEIIDTRRIKLKNGVMVRREIRISPAFVTRKPGIDRDILTILKPLTESPKHEGKPFEISVAWDGYVEDNFETSPNAVLYEKHNKDEWEKTWVYIDKNGRVERPLDTEIFVGKGKPELKVAYAPVPRGELITIQAILTSAGNLGSTDTSLVGLIGKEIRYDKQFAAKLSAEKERMRNVHERGEDDGDGQFQLYGEGNADEDSS